LAHRNSNLVFEYRYRDAGNYKVEGRVLLTGKLTAQQRTAIEERMESGQFFIAEQVGIPPLCSKLFEFGGGPNSEDHAWHEFDGFRSVASHFQSAKDDTVMSAEKLFRAFKSVECWKPELSPNFA
jgi:hypothetical protein